MVSGGSLPASGKPRRMPSAGAASASSSAVPTITAVQGRRWTAWLQRAAGDSLSPSLVEAPAEERDPQAVDPRAEVGEQRRQQRDRGQHHHQHGDGGRDGHAVHVGQAGQGEPEHGDHHGGAGDDHAAPGGGHGLDHRVVAVLAVAHRRAEAGQDEQRVVDAHADPDQPGDRRGPVGHVDDVGQQDDQPPDEMPRPTRAITSGRPAATTEPKAISSTIAAPRKPSPSGLDASCAA